MKLLRLILTTLILAAGITACQKEIPAEGVLNPPPPPNTVSDSNYLFRMYEIGIEGSVTDTFDVWTYTYDANKRVTHLSDTSFVTGADRISEWEYFYNGTDTLPFKSIVKVHDGGFISTDSVITYFYYNSSGQRIRDSIIFQDGNNINYQKNYYQYLPGKIYGVSKDSIFAGSSYVVQLTFDTAITVNENIISNKKSTGVYPEKVVSTFTYDDKPSPFSKLSNFKTFEVFPFGETFFYEMPEKNNRLKAIEVSENSYTYDENLTGKYSYGPNGYPSQLYYPDPLDPTSIYKVSFLYKAL